MQPVVEIELGRLRGVERRGVRIFRAVPYAAPPVGPLRLRPPEPPEPWGGARDATRVGAVAPQPRPIALPGPLRGLLGGGVQREDCLTLNVFTPGLDDARRPVLVWIHGGAFVLGAGSTPIYSGRRLARGGDAVVVTLNYRLGVLGFAQLGLLGLEGAEETLNLGLQDQVAALRFVREHIRAFGGDPGNVTIFGESAGAMSVGTLLGTPAARPLFQRAILQSGAAHNVSGPERAAQAAHALLRELGGDARSALRTLAEAPVEAILAAQQRATAALGIAHGTLPWQPAVDGRVVPRQPLEAIAAGECAGIPVLVGTNRDEWKLFTLFDTRTRRLDAAGLRRRLERILPGKDEEGVAFADRALDAYRSARAGPSGATPLELWEAIQGDRIFRYPAARLAELQAAHEPRTYQYLFEWTPRLARRRVGACHALEIPFVFGTLRQPLIRALIGASGGALALSRAMRDAWVAFARSGEPASPALGPWRPYTARERTTMLLGPRPEAVRAPLEEERRFWEPHLATPATA
jgi:para-nitrobenzyl esterase